MRWRLRLSAFMWTQLRCGAGEHASCRASWAATCPGSRSVMRLMRSMHVSLVVNSLCACRLPLPSASQVCATFAKRRRTATSNLYEITCLLIPALYTRRTHHREIFRISCTASLTHTPLDANTRGAAFISNVVTFAPFSVTEICVV
jgi:hypothetical protein